MVARLLLVDDEPDVLDSLREVLAEQGLDVATAQTPGQALELVRTEAFDAVLADYSMPAMSGCELVRRMKDIAPDLCAGLLTGHASEALEDGGLDPQVEFVLSKPPDVDQLMQAVQDMVTNR